MSRIAPRSLARRPLGRRNLAFLAASAVIIPGRESAAAQTPAPSLTVVGKDGWLFPLWDVMSRMDAVQLRSVTQVLNEAVGAIRQAGVEVVVALVPSKARTYRQFLPNGTSLGAEVDRRYPTAMAELRRSGAQVPDLDTPFQAARASQMLYFRQDTHWLPAGAELAAQEIARQAFPALRLPASARPGTQLGAAVTATNPTSDLLRFLPQAERSKYPPEQYQARQAVAAASPAALIEDDSADVVVLGNSFAQPRYGFQAQLSNRLNRPVALAWKPNNFGAYHTLLEYLRGSSFKRQKPRVIVWQHLEFDMQNMPNSSSWGQHAMPPQAFLAGVREALRG